MSHAFGSIGKPSVLSLPPWHPTPRHDVEATVVAHRQIVGHEFEIVFHAPVIARTAQPGQFVEILFGENYAPLVRRPFSLYRVDRAAATFSVLYLARGSFTSALARKQEGDTVSLLGPLGRPFHLAADLTNELNVRHILVAGGIGAPPLYFLASELALALAKSPEDETFTSRQDRSEGARHNNELEITRASSTALDATDTITSICECAGGGGSVPGGLSSLASLVGEAIRERTDIDSRIIVINAARTESLLVGLTEFGDLEIALHVMTDDGSRGAKGMATEMLSGLLDAEISPPMPARIYACGPMPMLRSVGEIAIARDLPCQLSIETPMPCGIGLCQGCAIPVHDPSSPSGVSYALGCIDGPVFEARDLVW